MLEDKVKYFINVMLKQRGLIFNYIPFVDITTGQKF